ncbi:hypothetical protein HZF05_11905 [Sphingomonas sp. CGMCC 1.13654]|uniref:Tetratricopeptide repeat protein n=1 Tax=Sphingomonas chungangi TaxID=2683589 RepID=A0A838L633_9SPHN|nr:putative 2OG-Fe(II) oxygenase [Sphingomonas chungangi]MBA2934801.1 hypothetical protein [Sphingomonas chungangi]
MFEDAAKRAVDDIVRYSALLGLTRALSDQDRDGEAERACRAAIRLLPDRATAHAMLALLIERGGRAEAALDAAEQAAARAPRNPAMHNLVASMALATRRDEAALTHSDAALAIDPHDQRALSDRWLALWRLGRSDEARSLLDPQRDLLIEQSGGDLPRSMSKAILQAPGLDEPGLGLPLVDGLRLTDIAALPASLVDRLHARLRDTLSRYRLPGPPHPLATGRPAAPVFRGWANIMRAGAYERSHIHEGGWLSAVFYPAVPVAMDGGAILMGGHPRDEDRIAPVLELTPTAGMMLLFPSFLYHRTEPFRGAGRRLSVAIDIARDGARSDF